jgi:hypothetical protein
MPDDPAEGAIVVLVSRSPAAASVRVVIGKQALGVAIQMAFAFHDPAAGRLSGVEVGILDGHGARLRDAWADAAGPAVGRQPLQRNQSPSVLVGEDASSIVLGTESWIRPAAALWPGGSAGIQDMGNGEPPRQSGAGRIETRHDSKVSGSGAMDRLNWPANAVSFRGILHAYAVDCVASDAVERGAPDHRYRSKAPLGG